MAVYLQILRGETILREIEVDRHVEVGRCHPDERLDDPLLSDPSPDREPSVEPGTATRVARFKIAEATETSIPRVWFRLQPLADGQSVSIENIHSSHAVFIEDLAGPIGPGETRCLELRGGLTVRLMTGESLRICPVATRRVQAPADLADGMAIRSLTLDAIEDSSQLPSDGARRVPMAEATLRPLAEGKGMEARAVVSLVRKALRVVEAAASSDGFLDAAVRAAVEIIGLDRAVVVVPDGLAKPEATSGNSIAPALLTPAASPTDSSNRPAKDASQANRDEPPRVEIDGVSWAGRTTHLAAHSAHGTLPQLSRSVLGRVIELRRTQIYSANLESLSVSLDSVSSVVAAPILDRDGSVAAVLYGDRWLAGPSSGTRISELEAVLLDVLASALAAGIARQQEERSRANLSEFFSPRVASLLVRQPELLEGRDAEVSVLFADIRGFSALSELHGPAKTIAWINDVMTVLSQCVVDTDGVLVDYVGDELLAMWGAPNPQPDHARRALQAARAMMQSIEQLRQRWADSLGSGLDIGIGLNTGPARVGNVGSRLKFKYGVLGHTVNVGSRLQGASKQLGVRCVASKAAVQAAGATELSRRLATLRVSGIRETVEVFECVADPDASWHQLRNDYEAALEDLRQQHAAEAVQRLGRLLQQFPEDRPSAMLLQRAAQVLSDPTGFDAQIWELERK